MESTSRDPSSTTMTEVSACDDAHIRGSLPSISLFFAPSSPPTFLLAQARPFDFLSQIEGQSSLALGPIYYVSCILDRNSFSCHSNCARFWDHDRSNSCRILTLPSVHTYLSSHWTQVSLGAPSWNTISTDQCRQIAR